MSSENNKSREYYCGLAKKYSVPLERITSPDAQVRYKAIFYAFRRVNFGHYLDKDDERETQDLTSSVFSEVSDLAHWLQKTYPNEFLQWREMMLRDLIEPHLEKMKRNPKQGKLALGVNNFDIAFYQSDSVFYEKARKAILFPGDRNRDNV